MAKKNVVVAGRKLFERHSLYLPAGRADGTGEWEFLSTACFSKVADDLARNDKGDEVLLCKIVPVAVYRRKNGRMVRTRIVGGGKK